jgi:hypothetical protein
MFPRRADGIRNQQSATDLLQKLEQGKNSAVPLRVTYTIESGKIIHDIHERKWKEWFSELFCNRSQMVEINRRVATALSTVLLEDEDNRVALQHIHTLADNGAALSAASVYKALFNTEVFLAPADPSDAADKVKIESMRGDPSTVDADICLLDIGDLAIKERGYVQGRPQLYAFASLADQAIEFARIKPENKEIKRSIPIVEIPRCELKAKRVLTYSALPRKKYGVKDEYKDFFKALFTNTDITGSLVVQIPKFTEGREGLMEAVKEIKILSDLSVQRIVLVSDDDVEQGESGNDLPTTASAAPIQNPSGNS